jgi:very-short-patch-repair endonuclease
MADIKKICKLCESIYFVFPYREKMSNYCSKKCLWNSLKGKKSPNSKRVQKKCHNLSCENVFLVTQGQLKRNKKFYCSSHCYYKSKIGKSIWFNGRIFNEKHRKNISKALTGKKQTKEHIKNSLKRRTMSNLEIKFQKVIDKYNLPYKFVGNGKFFIERKNPDFINVNGEKKAVEVYWKKHKDLFRGSSKQWMEERKKIFNKYGWQIIFIENEQINNDFIILNLLKGGK